MEYYLQATNNNDTMNDIIRSRILDGWDISNKPFQISTGSNSRAYAILFERDKSKIKKDKNVF